MEILAVILLSQLIKPSAPKTPGTLESSSQYAIPQLIQANYLQHSKPTQIHSSSLQFIQANMNPPIYSLFLAHLPFANSALSPLLASPATHSLPTHSLPYSSNLLYSTCLVTPYPLYPNLLSVSQLLPEPGICWSADQSNSKLHLSLPSTKGIESERDSRSEQEQPSLELKNQTETKRSEPMAKIAKERAGQKKVIGKGQDKGSRYSKDKNYVPFRNDKKEVRKRQKENENRNIIPNQLNQILSFIEKRAKSGRVLDRIWSKSPPDQSHYSISRFYLLMRHLKARVGQYGTEGSFRLFNSLIEPECKIWSEEEQRHYIKLSRALIGHFLREDCIFSILTSKRMKSEKKLEHLRARRMVANLVKNALSQT